MYVIHPLPPAFPAGKPPAGDIGKQQPQQPQQSQQSKPA
jgi:hypothetical protein